MNTNEFITKAREIHGDRYDYRKSVYHYRKPVVITCKIHGDFSMRYDHHVGPRKGGCRECYFDSLKRGAEETIRRFSEIHNNEYSYDKSQDFGNKSVIKISCAKHGEFRSTVANHISGTKCPACARERQFTPLSRFVEKSRLIHGDKYDYAESIYTGSDKHLRIGCPEHGFFEKTPDNHTHKTHPQGCPKCVEYHGYDDLAPGYVYALSSSCGSFVKIGISNKPDVRFAVLKKKTPFEINKMLQVKFSDGSLARAAERQAHARMNNCGFSGFDGCTEWFLLDDVATDVISILKRGAN